VAYKSLLDALEKDDHVLEHEPLDPSTLIASVPSSKQEDKSPTLLDTLTSVIRGRLQSPPVYDEDDDDDADAGISVVDGFKCMSLEPQETRFFGKSSGVMLIQEVIEAKKNYTGPSKWHPSLSFRNLRPEFWCSPQVS